MARNFPFVPAPASVTCDSELTRLQASDKVTESALVQFYQLPDVFSRHHMEIIMKHERFLTAACRVICALSAFALIGGTSAAFAQTAADKSPTKGSAMPAVTQSSSMDRKGSMMPGMAAGGDMHGSMTGMMKNMESMKMSGDTDRDFATMMKVHHQGAIDMAQMELQSGKDAKMRAMAKRIIKAQQKEIKEFDQWLGKPR